MHYSLKVSWLFFFTVLMVDQISKVSKENSRYILDEMHACLSFLIHILCAIDVVV